MILCVTNVYALRVSKPVTLSNPITDDQLNQLNKFLEEIWLVQNGRQEIDVVTTSKVNARNGEMWILTGSTVKLEFKAGGNVYSITP